MANFILQIKQQHLSHSAKIKIDNLINDTIINNGGNNNKNEVAATHPPHIILIQDFEPLRLAKKKHYVPYQSALKIQKRTGSNKPQGRPFNSNLNARFLLFNNINDLILNLLNIKELKIGHLGSNNFDLSTNNMTIQPICQSSDQLTSTHQLKSISFEKFNDHSSKFEIYNELCKIFNVKELSFIKTIRNNKGKLIKFEIMSFINSNELNIDFIKKFITYPRYKSKMKIFLINQKFDQNIWFYNDLRMLIWDINNLKIENTNILINTEILK